MATSRLQTPLPVACCRFGHVARGCIDERIGEQLQLISLGGNSNAGLVIITDETVQGKKIEPADQSVCRESENQEAGGGFQNHMFTPIQHLVGVSGWGRQL